MKNMRKLHKLIALSVVLCLAACDNSFLDI